MKKISVEGGALVVCAMHPPAAARTGGRITYCRRLNTTGSTSRVPGEGGTPQPVTGIQAPGETTHRWPQTLPGGKVLFTVSSSLPAGFEDANIGKFLLRPVMPEEP